MPSIPQGTHFSEIVCESQIIFIQESMFESIICKVVAILSQLQCDVINLRDDREIPGVHYGLITVSRDARYACNERAQLSSDLLYATWWKL